MNIYRIVMETKALDENNEPNFIDEYLTHDYKYSNEEFKNICDEAFLKCKDKDLFDLTTMLKKCYRFKDLFITANYEFLEQ